MKNPFAHPKCVFDTSKLPTGLALALRAVFELALKLTRDHDDALDVSLQVLFHLTTDKPWDPARGSLVEHALSLVRPAYRQLRYGSREEKRACATFAFEQRKTNPSPEDEAIRLEEEPEVERSEKARLARAAAVKAALAHQPVASGIIGLWEARGYVKPAVLAAELCVSVKTVYRAIELIRWHARKERPVEPEESTEARPLGPDVPG